jgi:hypothetical protein
MADVGVAVFNDNGAAAGEIHAAELLDVFAYSDWSSAVRCHDYLLRFDEPLDSFRVN